MPKEDIAVSQADPYEEEEIKQSTSPNDNVDFERDLMEMNNKAIEAIPSPTLEKNYLSIDQRPSDHVLGGISDPNMRLNSMQAIAIDKR